MDLAALKLLDVDDIEVVETDDLVAVSATAGIVNTPAPHYHRHCSPLCSAPHCHPIGPAAAPPCACFPTCGPFHTHAVGELPDGPPEL